MTKQLLDAKVDTLPVEIAIDFLESYVRNGIYNDNRAKDKLWREIALKELEICIDTIQKNIQ